MIQFTIEGTGTFELGETVRGHIVWTPESDKVPRHFTISLQWKTLGRGYPNRATVSKVNVDIQRVSEGQPITIPFALQLPLDAPATYIGSLLWIVWDICVDIDMPWTTDHHAEVRLNILPLGSRKKGRLAVQRA
jgi:hypothetical protein